MRWLWGREEVHIGFWWGNLRERDHLEDQGVDRRIIGSSRSGMGGLRTELIWFRIGKVGGHL